MKKAITLAIAIIMALSLAACGGEVTPTASPAPTPKITPEPTPEKDERGIIGSHLTDITLNCEKFGLTEHTMKAASEDTKSFYAHYVDSFCENALLDARIDYSLTADTELQITGCSFGLNWLITQDNSVFVAAAQTYLGFAATIPYDTSDTESAKTWVQENIPSVADGESVSTTIGDATFELFGVKVNGYYTAFWLTISKAKI